MLHSSRDGMSKFSVGGILFLWGINLALYVREHYCRGVCVRLWEGFSTPVDVLSEPSIGWADVDGTCATDSEDLLVFAADTFEFVAQDGALVADVLGAALLPGALAGSGLLFMRGCRVTARFLKR